MGLTVDRHRFFPGKTADKAARTLFMEQIPRRKPSRSRDGGCHVYDRGIFSFELVAAHGDRASFVHRLREPGPRTPRFEADEERPLTDADRKAGVISDRLGRLAGSQHRAAPPGRYREVVIAVPGEPGNQVRLLTDVLDVPAHVIGQIYPRPTFRS